MGQKVNPHGYRVGVIKNWDSRWFVSDEKFGDTIVSDYNLRNYLKEKFASAGVPKIEIERDAQRVRIIIHCARPAFIIGKQGDEIKKLKETLEKMCGTTVMVSVVEVRDPDLNSQLVAENIASQIERRIAFRRAMKLAVGRTMRLGAKGIKVLISGRLNGAEIARSEHYHEGTIPLQTLRADIDYGFAEAKTTYGRIGIKVWIYKGEVLADSSNKTKRNYDKANGKRRNDRKNRSERRQGEGRGDRRQGNGRFGDRRQAPVNYGNRNPNFKRPAKPEAAPAPEAEAPTTEGGAE